MKTKFDPTMSSVTSRDQLAADASEAEKISERSVRKTRQSHPRAMERPPAAKTPAPANTHPSRRGPHAAPSKYEQRIAALRAQLRAKRAERLSAASEALRLCASYAARRSRGARRRAKELCEEVTQEVPSYRALAGRMREALEAEAQLQEMSAEETLSGCSRLIELLEGENDGSQS